MRRRSILVGAVLAVTLLVSACDYRGVGSVKAALFGDSVADDADEQTVAVMRRSYRYLRFNLRSGAIGDQLIPLALLLREDPPDTLVLELGIGDAQLFHTDGQMATDIVRVLDATRGVPCVRWPNLKMAGVNGFYRGVVARSDDFNRILARLIARYPNAEMVDYDSWAQARPQYFLTDGLHHNGLGRTAYGQWLTNTVAGGC
jgi:lysophospholipase L1-like esterase